MKSVIILLLVIPMGFVFAEEQELTGKFNMKVSMEETLTDEELNNLNNNLLKLEKVIQQRNNFNLIIIFALSITMIILITFLDYLIPKNTEDMTKN